MKKPQCLPNAGPAVAVLEARAVARLAVALLREVRAVVRLRVVRVVPVARVGRPAAGVLLPNR